MKIDGMDFKPVSGGDTKYVKPSELPTDKPLVGTYLGVVESQYGKNYKLQTKDGITIVNGCGSLHNSMAGVEINQVVALTYGGKKKLTKGKFAGKEFHSVNVSVADGPKTAVVESMMVSKGDNIPF